MFRCKACNSKITNVKSRKPVTTFSGQMNSVYSDRMDSFPVSEYEDLCNRCISEIQYYNNDLNCDWSLFESYSVVTEHRHEEMSEVRLDLEFLQVQREYEGY